MVDVMEDQGSYGDRDSGAGSADGQWHHVAVTWASSDGQTNLYLDGRKVCMCCAVLCCAVLCCAVLQPPLPGTQLCTPALILLLDSKLQAHCVVSHTGSPALQHVQQKGCLQFCDTFALPCVLPVGRWVVGHIC